MVYTDGAASIITPRAGKPFFALWMSIAFKRLESARRGGELRDGNFRHLRNASLIRSYTHYTLYNIHIIHVMINDDICVIHQIRMNVNIISHLPFYALSSSISTFLSLARAIFLA